MVDLPPFSSIIPILAFHHRHSLRRDGRQLSLAVTAWIAFTTAFESRFPHDVIGQNL